MVEWWPGLGHGRCGRCGIVAGCTSGDGRDAVEAVVTSCSVQGSLSDCRHGFMTFRAWIWPEPVPHGTTYGNAPIAAPISYSHPSPSARFDLFLTTAWLLHSIALQVCVGLRYKGIGQNQSCR